MVIGLTVVAFGTSTPDLAVSVQAALAGNADLAVGNVVGSNIFIVLFILGVGWNGSIGRLEGLTLFFGIVIYTWWCVRQSRKDKSEVLAEFEQGWPPTERRAIGLNLALIVAGLCLLGLGARVLNDGSVQVAASRGRWVSSIAVG